MAQTSDRVKARNQLLHYDHAIVDDLVEMTAEWDEVPENERFSFMHDWDQFALQHIPRLIQYAANGELTAEQEAEYHRLIQRVKEHTPLMRQFGLAIPRVPVKA